VHYSTDYVFDGSGQTPWRETDATGPLSVYGRTKLAGEQAIVAAGGAHLIFAPAGSTPRAAATSPRPCCAWPERERLTVIDDQWGAPTGAELLADVSAHAIAQVLASPPRPACITWPRRARPPGFPMQIRSGAGPASAISY
jgi:dTDP-4-dehydrorhamnose reductase